MNLKPIGEIESVYKQKFGAPRQSLLVKEAKAVLHLNKELVPLQALDGLFEFSHIWLIFGFHQNAPNFKNSKVSPPRLKGERVGVFASRSPHRINPIGLSCVELTQLKYPRLYLSGVDVVDKTPVYDIKPYIHQYDSIPKSHSGWVDRLEPCDEMLVEMSEQALQMLNSEQKDLIENTLKRDPRPLCYKKSKYKNVFKMLIADFEVEFQYTTNRTVFVDKIIVLRP